MADLSPSAQAVLDAYNAGFIRPVAVHHKPRIAAALRAAADQVASPIPDDCTADVFNRQLKIRADLLAIAAELEAQ